MRKILPACFCELVLVVTGWYLIPPPWFGPFLLSVTVGVGIAVLWAYRGDIRLWLDPSERVIRRGEREMELGRARQRRSLRQQVSHMRRYGEVTYSPDGMRLHATLKRRTWRRPIIDRACWMTNHHLLPACALRFIAHRLGFEEHPGGLFRRHTLKISVSDDQPPE